MKETETLLRNGFRNKINDIVDFLSLFYFYKNFVVMQIQLC